MPETRRRYVIVGNGVAGTTAADTLRKTDANCSITLIGDEPYTLYNRVALPPYVKRKVPRAKVFIFTREWHEQRGIDLRLETRVVAVDAVGKTVTTDRGETIPYDALLVATGGRPNRLALPGADAPNVFNFQYLRDADAISEYFDRARSAAIIGGSYIAYELAEAARSRGLHTTWIMRGPRFLRRILDEEGGALVDAIARSHGVTMVYGQELKAVQRDNGLVTGVVLKDGRTIQAEMVGVGLGLTMNTELLAGTSVEVRHGIVTDPCLRTNVEGIFAAGDVAEFLDLSHGGYSHMGTWNNAASHGKVAGLNMAGGEHPYVDVPYYTTTLFDSRMSVVGITPETNPELESVVRTNWEARTYKKLFFKEDRLVGAVLIGDLRAKAKLTQLIQYREPIKDRAALLDL